MSLPLDTSVDIPLPPQPISRPTRPFYWSVRREIWENRSIYLAPAGVAAAVLFGFCISLFHLPGRIHVEITGDEDLAAIKAVLPFFLAPVSIMAVGFLTSIVYSLGALHGERRDRSILFWKSLPVSDLTTVFAKLTIPMIVLPVIVLAVAIVTQGIMLALSALVLMASGVSGGPLWALVHPVQIWIGIGYSLAAFVLWYAPLYGWFMLVSGWARRAPFLWAVVPPALLSVVERFAFGTNHLGLLLRDRIGHGLRTAFVEGAFAEEAHSAAAHDVLSKLDPVRFLSNPDLWIGLVVAVGLFAAAIRMRRYRTPL